MKKAASPTWVRNWLDQAIWVGDTIIYPAMGGRSCQMTEGVVLKIKVMTEEEAKAKFGTRSRYSQEELRYFTEDVPLEKWEHHIGEAVGMTVKPTGRNSRWTQHWSSREGEAKPVHLTGNAASVVKVEAK